MKGLPAIVEKILPLTTAKVDELRGRLSDGIKQLNVQLADWAIDIWHVHHFALAPKWGYSSFYDYCTTELGFSRSTSHRLKILGHLVLSNTITIEQIREKGIRTAFEEYALPLLPPQKGFPRKLPASDQGGEPQSDRVFITLSFRREDWSHVEEVLKIASLVRHLDYRQNYTEVFWVMMDMFWAAYLDGEFDYYGNLSELDLACLERDGWRCVQCESYGPLQVHHIVRRSAGGKDALDNLQSLCHRCHTEEHTGERPK